MAYVKQNFVDGNVLYASELNHIEDGIADAALDDLSNVTNATVAGKIGTGAITATKIASNAVSTLYTATIPANGWTAFGGRYYNQIVTVQGVLSTDNPVVDVNMAQVSGADGKEAANEAWGTIFYANASANAIQFYANDIPTIDIPIKILCIRK